MSVSYLLESGDFSFVVLIEWLERLPGIRCDVWIEIMFGYYFNNLITLKPFMTEVIIVNDYVLSSLPLFVIVTLTLNYVPFICAAGNFISEKTQSQIFSSSSSSYCKSSIFGNNNGHVFFTIILFLLFVLMKYFYRT